MCTRKARWIIGFVESTLSTVAQSAASMEELAAVRMIATTLIEKF
jgi:hypothetical protein